MSRLPRLIFCCLSLLLAVIHFHGFSIENFPQSSSELSVADDPVSVDLISEQSSFQPGHPTWVAIRMSMENHWHAYWKNPGDAGMAPVITWNLPEGFEVGQVLWPIPSQFHLGEAVGLGYEKEVIFLVEITPPAAFEPTSSVEISADIRWVVCSDDTCLPGDAHLALSLPLSHQAAEADARWTTLFAKARSLMPKKHDAITAQRTSNGIQLTFTDDSESAKAFQSALFFSEQQKTIEYPCNLAIDHSTSDSTLHTVTLKEVPTATGKASSLKGVLVVSAPSSKEAYDIDVLVENNGKDPEIISMSQSTYAVGNRVSTLQTSPSLPVDDHFAFEGGIGLALFFAFLGGMILNLMPCVLPVISLKILSFVKLAGESRKLIFQHGLAFSFGVLVSFWTLAGALLALQAYGRAVGWGFQLQEPIFVAILAACLLMFTLSLFGLFEMGTSLVSAAGNTARKRGMLGSFVSGIFATAVATPCTGPFLGSTVGFAVTLPPAQAMLIFTFLGLGMSLPYLVLAAFPSLLRFMPKAGNWMGAFKELMGFFMLATVLWLTWIFGAQTSNFALSLLLAGFFFIALACWVYGRWSSPINKRSTRYISTLFSAAIFGCGAYIIFSASSPWAESMGGSNTNIASAYVDNEWEEFSVERVAELRKQGIPVFIDFTAKWCLICQANHVVLSTDEVSRQFEKRGVVKMKADWTKNDPAIAAELRKFGRNSVPLYLLYNESDEQPQILPQLLTPEVVVDSLQQI